MSKQQKRLFASTREEEMKELQGSTTFDLPLRQTLFTAVENDSKGFRRGWKKWTVLINGSA